MVSIGNLTEKLPKIETSAVAALTILNGSGGAGVSPQSVANIIARITGPFNAGGFGSSQGQTVVGSPGWRFVIKPELTTGIGLLVADYILGALPSFPYKSTIRKYITKPVGTGLLGGALVNIILGDPPAGGNVFPGNNSNLLGRSIFTPSSRGYSNLPLIVR